MSRAFLSYTHIDDEFFAGAITALRKSLELGVRVVTGDRNFSIFQDQEGIELGQKWQRRLDEAVASATFLIPVMTPSYFSSNACRDELMKFVIHEKEVRREDLILPIYFVTAPQIERADLLQADALALEISKRQRFDWREQADLSMDDPKIRRAIMSLASKISVAMNRVNVDGHSALSTANLNEAAGRVREELVQRQKSRKSRILWVDDRPNNNIIERKSFREYNVDVEITFSTEEALVILKDHVFDAIISDMGRPPDYSAGYTLLEQVRSRKISTPYFIYAGSRSPEHTREALRRGAQGNTNRGDELIKMVLGSLMNRAENSPEFVSGFMPPSFS